MTTQDALNLFLKKQFKEECGKFTEEEKTFLIRYSIKKEYGKTNTLLKDMGLHVGEQTYYRGHEHVRKAVKRLQDTCYKRFAELQKRVEVPFENSFEKFFQWWCSEMDESGNRHCCYCGVDENTVQQAFQTVLSSKKPSFNGSLQIERIEPDGGYNSTNCHFACVLCNNAKSDMISSEDFQKYFAPGVKEYWEHIKKEYLEK